MASPPPSYQEASSPINGVLNPPQNAISNGNGPSPTGYPNVLPVQILSHLPPKIPAKKIPPPISLPPATYQRCGGPLGSAVPTPLPYATPMGTPFNTAPNTPMFIPPGQAPVQQSMQMMSGQPMCGQQLNTAPQYGIPMQQFTYPPSVQPMPQGNGPINVVVNANANSAAEGGEGVGLGCGPNGQKMKICPNCRKGVIVREQHKKRAKKIKLLAFLTSCCLCCLPCCCLRRNFIDQCKACDSLYGKPGGKKAKKIKYA